MRRLRRVLVPVCAALLAVGCILGAVAVGQRTEPDFADALRSGPTTKSDFPMDFGVYVTSSDASILQALAEVTAANALVPQPAPTWNVRFPTNTDEVLLWFGPADGMSLYEGVQTTSNRNGLWGGELTAPLTVHLVLPGSAHEIETCATWWDATGIHSVGAQIMADDPWTLVTCEIPAVGAFDSLHIAMAFDWIPFTADDSLTGMSTLAIENQAFPLLPTEIEPTAIATFGFAQPLLVDVFTPQGWSVSGTTPDPTAANPIQARWLLQPGSSLFVTHVDNFKRGISEGLGQLLLIGAGAFFAIAVERTFKRREGRSP